MPNTLYPPPEVIASWPKPNYVDPETRGPALEYLCIILSALGILMVSARLYSRMFITKAPGIDDILIVCALGFGITMCVFVIIGNKVYLSGHHIWDVPIEKDSGHRLNVWISQWFYVYSLMCIKISVLLFYRRLSVSFSRLFMVATWIGIIYNVLYALAFSLALLLMFRPVDAYWMSFNPEWATTHTYSGGEEQIAEPLAGGFSVVGDFYSAALPMILITGLALPRRQKLALYALFATGFMVVGAGIARTVFLYKMLNEDYDFTWILWETWIWAIVELYVAMLAASAPALKPFLRRFLIEPLESVSGGSRRRDGSSNRTYVLQSGDKAGNGRGWSNTSSQGGGAYPADVENLRIADRGAGMAKSHTDNIVRELDDSDLETRHFELRASRDGKIVPMQVRKKREREEIAVVALPPEIQQSTFSSIHNAVTINRPDRSQPQQMRIARPVSAQRGPHRSFSQPRPPTYDERPGGSETVNRYGDERARQKGSVKAARLSAKVAQTAKETRVEPRNSPFGAEDTHENIESRLDSPSESEEEAESGGEGKRMERLPWNKIHSPTVTSSLSSRSGSVETLHLPRMGSRDFYPERSRERVKGEGVGGGRGGVGYAL